MHKHAFALSVSSSDGESSQKGGAEHDDGGGKSDSG